MVRATAAQAQRLDDVVLQVVEAWARGDAKALAALSAREGIAIEGREVRTGPLGSRQAAAVLRRIFDDRETVAIRPGMVQMVGGSPRRAFLEITWVARAPETTQPERTKIFVELVLNHERWQITQIRMLP